MSSFTRRCKCFSCSRSDPTMTSMSSILWSVGRRVCGLGVCACIYVDLCVWGVLFAACVCVYACRHFLRILIENCQCPSAQLEVLFLLSFFACFCSFPTMFLCSACSVTFSCDGCCIGLHSHVLILSRRWPGHSLSSV